MLTHKLIIRAIIAVSGIALIGGCSVPSSSKANGPSVTTASIVIVNQDLDIPNKRSRVYTQNGAITLKRDLDPWAVYCSVLMQKRQSSGGPSRTVLPGQFGIIKVLERNERQETTGNFVASKDEWHHVPPIVIFRVEMRLESDEQPGVRSLICAKQVESYTHHYPTLAEMRVALGALIAIKTP